MARRLAVSGMMGMASVILLALVSLIGFGSLNADAQRIAFSIATGPSSGTYFPVGEIIAGLISHPPGVDRCVRSQSCGPEGLIATAQTSPGAYANVLAVESGRANSALAQSDIVAQAIAGKGPFKTKQTHIRTIAALFPEEVHLIVSPRSKIKDIYRLRGKRVSVGAADSGTAVTARAVLSAFRVRVKASDDPPDVAAQKLRDGKIDAFFFVGGTPVPVVASLIDSGRGALLPIDGKGRTRLLAREKGMSADVIPAGTYSRGPTVETVSVRALWIVSDQTPKDTVYGVARALFSPANRSALDQGPAAARSISISNAQRNLTAPLHPGAAKFYRDVGKS
ncbi:MAG TPA: TAXI family TRAP transporter solute-binding subunit [Rhizomicrobium sp.]|nr:TAXI family TRAP transporter solute-binding subunit [Rhizomicrobium sp.]